MWKDDKMQFYTAHNEDRPVRLSGATRKFAWESLQGKYGDLTMQTADVRMDDVAGFAEMSENRKYDAAIKKIAQEAPIRICEDERISGAATLGRAMVHEVPASQSGKNLWWSISHTTLAFDRVVKFGVGVIEREIAERLCRASENEREILISMQNAVNSMRIWHERYLAATKETNPGIFALLSNVPFGPATNFHEAVQSLWFTFAFTRLCGNWSAIGRIDEILGDYLKNDLQSGLLTLGEAREILASFFIKGCEWIQSNTNGTMAGGSIGGGDAQHYQNIILSGVDANGNDVTNDVTYLVLEIVEELGISDFPISVRISENTPEKLLRKVAMVMQHGGGVVAVYNESLIIDALTDFGYPLDEARSFANDGCWEVLIPGKTRFNYGSFDSLQVLLNDTFRLNSDEPACFDSMDALYDAYRSDLQNKVGEVYNEKVIERYTGQKPGKDWRWGDDTPCSVASIFVMGCVENARSYLQGGPIYNVMSPHIGGVPDAGNSLYAVEKLVFEEEKVTFYELMKILQANWEGHEELRQYALNNLVYYGNDNDAADAYIARILDDFARISMPFNGKSPILFPPGVSTFGRQIEWAPFRAAVPFGRRKGEVLSGNLSPTPGTDTTGATAVIKSYCKADLRKQISGSALDIKIFPTTVQGENGVTALVSLMKGFVSLGGYFMQLDIMDAEILRRAREHPEDYKTLSVRVSGWNARFITLSEEWQNMVIERTCGRSL